MQQLTFQRSEEDAVIMQHRSRRLHEQPQAPQRKQDVLADNVCSQRDNSSQQQVITPLQYSVPVMEQRCLQTQELPTQQTQRQSQQSASQLQEHTLPQQPQVQLLNQPMLLLQQQQQQQQHHHQMQQQLLLQQQQQQMLLQQQQQLVLQQQPVSMYAQYADIYNDQFMPPPQHQKDVAVQQYLPPPQYAPMLQAPNYMLMTLQPPLPIAAAAYTMAGAHMLYTPAQQAVAAFQGGVVPAAYASAPVYPRDLQTNIQYQ
jgi:hypothetical protein